MSTEITAGQMLDAFKLDAPGHVDGTRWAHTHGFGVVGRFVPSDVAGEFSVADHFQQVSRVTARFSNGSSEPVRHDERPDTRGLAVKFHLANGSACDMLAMTLNVFGANTREQFLGVSNAFVPKPVKPPSWFRRTIINPLMLRKAPPPLPAGVISSGGPGLAKYAGTHKVARGFIIEAGLLQVPASWARGAYHAVHTFILTDPAGARHPVRFSWQPVDGVFPLPPRQLTRKTTDFLSAEMTTRLAHAPARFTLKMVLGEPGDALNEPATRWPVTRRSVAMGTLYIEDLAKTHGIEVEHLSFNPMRLPAGIEPSDDAILHARGEIYQLGCGERNGVGCPLHPLNGSTQ